MIVLLEASKWLSRKTGHRVFAISGVACSVAVLALLFYGARREKQYGDKSETVSRRTTVTIFTGLALWVTFVFFHALAN